MNKFTKRVRRYGRAFFNLKTLVIVTGLLFSVVLHELFHVVMHWNHVLEVQLLPNHAAIVAITSQTAVGYNPQMEEFIAYGITMLTMLATSIIVNGMHDKNDTRTAYQTLFPHRTGTKQLTQREFYELAARINLI